MHPIGVPKLGPNENLHYPGTRTVELAQKKKTYTTQSQTVESSRTAASAGCCPMNALHLISGRVPKLR
eukprot:1964143-Rhodomonas_salina.1